MALSARLISLYAPWSLLPLDATVLLPPNEPINTFFKDRFIALHIKIVSNVPAAPTKIPPVSITLLSYKNPPQAAATPVKELSKEITTGISAPPIGKTNNTPYKSDILKIIYNKKD